MRIVVDTSVLVAELLRERGPALLINPHLSLFQPDHAAGETVYELNRRGAFLRQRRQGAEAEVTLLLENAIALASSQITIVPSADYAPYEAVARRRIPRDPDDWTLVAAALYLAGTEESHVGLLTLDGDFLGCGLPTWTPETLRSELT